MATPIKLRFCSSNISKYLLFILLFLSACCPCPVPNLSPVDVGKTFKHAEVLVNDIGSRPNGSEANSRASEYILDIFRQFGLKDPHYQIFQDDSIDGKNVVATASGSMYPQFIFLLGAHYDTIEKGVGSIDNATGIATLLEIARYFSEHPPKYSIRFVAFDVEENGIVGSGHYHQSSENSGELDSTLLMLNLDMTQTNESCNQHPLIAFVLTPTIKMGESFLKVKEELKCAGKSVHFIPVEWAKEVSGGGHLRGDIQYWENDSLLLAWPWAVSDEEIFHKVPGSISQIDSTGLAISTKFILEFIRNLLDCAPEDLLSTIKSPIKVEEKFLQMLKKRGGINPE